MVLALNEKPYAISTISRIAPWPAKLVRDYPRRHRYIFAQTSLLAPRCVLYIYIYICVYVLCALCIEMPECCAIAELH